MAAKRRAKKKYHAKRRKAKQHKARKRSGFGKSVSSGGYSLDTLPRIIVSALILRFGSGVIYWWFRGQFQKPGADPKKTMDNFNKAKIIFPLVVAIASAKKWIPQMPGLTPMAIAMAIFSIIENFDSLRDLFDLKAMDKKPVGPTPAVATAGVSARTWAETRQALENMHTRSGLMLSDGRRAYNGISMQRRPRTFSGRDPRAQRTRVA